MAFGAFNENAHAAPMAEINRVWLFQNRAKRPNLLT
jgi:hypothetical protein